MVATVPVMKRTVSMLLLVALATTILSGCDTVRAGTRCTAGSAPGRDATHVLFCTKGRWKRALTIGQAADIILGSQAAKIESIPARTVATGRAGGSITAFFTVTARNGAVLRGAKVVLSAPTTGAGLAVNATTTGVTADDGTVGFALPVGTVAGSFDLVATVEGTSVSTRLAVTVSAGAAANGVVTSGNGQSVPSGSALAPIVVKVTDAYGNPAAGQVVGVLDAPVGTPGGVLAQVTTGADGVATFSTLSARVVIIDSFFVLYIGAGTQLSTSLGTISYTARSSS